MSLPELVRRGIPPLFAVALSFSWAPALSAQATAGGELAEVEGLIAAGRFGEGRTVLLEWLDRGWDEASRAQREQGLWLRAILTIDPAIAELDYRRLAVEYPGGRFSDRALLRLAQGALARGDPEASLQFLETLARDYPESPVQLEARSLLVPISVPAAAPIDSAIVPASPASTSSSDLPVTIQLGAFSAEAAARALLSDPRLQGFGTRLVRTSGSSLFRVRIGAFATADEAMDLLRDMQSRGIQAIVSSDRDLERPIP